MSWRACAMAMAGLALNACSSAPGPEVSQHVEHLGPITAPETSRRPISADSCGAEPLQSLLGRPRTEIPIPLDPGRQRVACTTCPQAQDSRPDRLSFLFEAETGLISQIRCG